MNSWISSTYVIVPSLQANILSSHRSFLRRVDVLDIGNPGKGTKGDTLTIFIFSDSLEVKKGRAESLGHPKREVFNQYHRMARGHPHNIRILR